MARSREHVRRRRSRVNPRGTLGVLGEQLQMENGVAVTLMHRTADAVARPVNGLVCTQDVDEEGEDVLVRRGEGPVLDAEPAETHASVLTETAVAVLIVHEQVVAVCADQRVLRGVRVRKLVLSEEHLDCVSVRAECARAVRLGGVNPQCFSRHV